MVRCWFMSSDVRNLLDTNLTLPPKYVSLEDLKFRTGVQYLQVNTQVTDHAFENRKKDNGITHELFLEELISFKFKNLNIEHLVNDKIMYLTVSGNGYLDVRDKLDEWIRIEVIEGDLLTIPKNIFRRIIPLPGNVPFKCKAFSKKTHLICIPRPPNFISTMNVNDKDD